MKRFTTAATTACAAIGLALSATPAMAGDETAMVVKYDDLNLSTKAGQEHLERRIDAAAKKVCGISQRTGTRLESRGARKCYNRAKSQARAAFASVIEDSRRGG